MAIRTDDYSHYHPPREPFSREEELEMFRRFRAGDSEAAELLITVNIPFVIDCAHGMKTDSMSIEDLIEEGIIGLIAARDRFDPERGFKFISYAVWWIRQAMFSALNTFPHVVRLPLNQTAKLKKFHRTKHRLVQETSVLVTDSEVLAEMGENELQADWLVVSRGTLSLDLEPTSSSEEMALRRMLATVAEQPTIFSDLDQQELRDLFGQAIDQLSTERDRRIICMYYGWPDGGGMTLARIGEELGITRERVRQLRDKALVQLHKHLEQPRYNEALSR